MKKVNPDYVLLMIGIATSLFAVLGLPGLYFRPDMLAFWGWIDAWKSGWQSIYNVCTECNYPILGMFSSAGLLGLFSGLGFERAVLAHRIFLSLLDGLNIYLVYWIVKRLNVEKPAYLAGIIGISFSSWVGGALWGQIDGVSQLFILLLLAWVIKKNTSEPAEPGRYAAYLLVSAALLAGLLLTKQLTIFSAVSLVLMLAADLLFRCREWKTALLYSTLTLVAFLAAIMDWEFLLEPVPHYISHLQYVWTEGIFQAGIISGNGFNIWMLSGREMLSSAHIPLGVDAAQLSPYNLGQLLFVLLLVLFSLSLGFFLKERYQRGDLNLSREVLLNFILHLALVNLCFNVFLTGTRERYLFHFYPYAILAWAGLRSYNPIFTDKGLSVLVLAASLYGIFVLQILSSLDFGLGTSTHMLMAVFHLGLFVWMLWGTLRYQGFMHPRLGERTRENSG